MSVCTIIPFPVRKPSTLDRWLHHVVAAYCVIAIVFLVYGMTEYLSASTLLTAGSNSFFTASQNGFD